MAPSSEVQIYSANIVSLVTHLGAESSKLWAFLMITAVAVKIRASRGMRPS